MVKINLTDTALAGKILNKIKQEHSDNNWIHCWIENNIFEAAGGPDNLTEILNIFKEWVKNLVGWAVSAKPKLRHALPSRDYFWGNLFFTLNAV